MKSDGTEQIGYLMKAIIKKWRGTLDQRLASLGMSEARWFCLLHLGRAESPLPQVELAEAMGITPPSLVKLLDRLEEDGWVERLPEPQDRRAKRVNLTPKAHEMVKVIEDEAQKLRQEVWKGISASDRNICLRVLQQLESTLDSIPLNPSAEGEAS
ncbi:MAG: MarR family transcriptional regulator [Pedobacter sp.]|nr:MarR family transcriptional regulator [Pedobacter sp.]